MSAVQLEAQLGITYKTAWLLAQKLRRSMIDPQREPLEGVVEVDQAEIPFRADNSFFDPVKSGKILIAGAVEVIDRGTNQAKPRRKRAKYLDTRSGRIHAGPQHGRIGHDGPASETIHITCRRCRPNRAPAKGRTSPFRGAAGKVWNRRCLAVGMRSFERPERRLTDIR
jgi:hypothetical protein